MADGKVSENSIVFRAFYEALVLSIGLTNKLTVYGLIQAPVAAKTAIQKQKEESLRDAIDSSDPAVRAFVTEFAEVMMDIMMKNSTALNVTLWALHYCGRLFRGLRVLRRRIAVPSRPRQIYESYRYFERMHSAVAR